MAVRRKASDELPPGGSSVRPITEERNRDREEIENEQNDLRERIMAHGVSTETAPPPPVDTDVIKGSLGTKPDAVPVGGAKKEDPPPKPVVPAVPPESVPGQIPTDDQFNAELDKVGKFTPKTEVDRQGIAALRGFASKWHTTAKELDTKLKEEQRQRKELETKVLPEPELNRLRHIEKMVETQMVEQLPEWGEYDKAVAGVERAAANFLTQTGAIQDFDKVLEVINKRGGISKFANSNNPAGKGSPGMTESQWFKQNIFDKLDEQQKIRLTLLLSEADTKRTEKETKLTERKTNAKATLEAEQKKANEHLKSIWEETVRELNETILPNFDLPLTKPMIGATDTPDEKKEKQEIIDIWDAVEKNMNRNIAQNPKDLVSLRYKEAAFDPMMARYGRVKKERDDYKQKFADAQEQLDKIRSSKRLGRTMTVDTPPAAQQKNDMELSTEEALAKAGFPVSGVNR